MTTATRKPFRITYKTSPKSRKIMTAVQYHESPESAAQLVLIKDHEPEAVCLTVDRISECECVCGSTAIMQHAGKDVCENCGLAIA